MTDEQVHKSLNAAAQGTRGRNGERLETDLTDEGRALIEPFLPPASRIGCQRTVTAAVSAC